MDHHVNRDGLRDVSALPKPQVLVIGLQHVLAMFGATILVPILTGLHVSVALFTAGGGTLLFHLITRGKVPAYLGSSFAFIPPIALAVQQHGGIPGAQGGIIAAGIIYIIVALIVTWVGTGIIRRLFPPIVTGPVIMLIGLTLAPVAIDMAGGSWQNVAAAVIALGAAVGVAVFTGGFFRIIPVLMGLVVGYIGAAILGLVDLSPFLDARWFGLPEWTMPKVNWTAISLIAPVAIVPIVEHVGDIFAISTTIGKKDELIRDPGLHRTLGGDGVATFFAGLFGGPPNTTYGENIGVLALTKVYDPKVMQIGAVFAVILGLVPKLEGLIQTIPGPVIGGISILLFGMIAAVGLRTVVENNVDLKASRNLIIASVILVIGLGGAVVSFWELEFSGMALAAIVGIILNQVLPQPEGEEA